MITARLPVVVLRSNDTCFLGCLRGLAGAGAPVVPVVFDYSGAPPWFSKHSRYLQSPVNIPNPVEYEANAVEALEHLGRDLTQTHGARPLAISSSDTNLMLMLRNWERLGRYYRLPGDSHFDCPRADVVDKARCADILQSNGVPVPVTMACTEARHVDRVAATIPMPAVYKPAIKDLSHSFYRAHGGSKAIVCSDRHTLARKLYCEMEDGFPLVVQEQVEFNDAYDEIPIYVYADQNHRIRMAVTAVKESIHPYPFGTASVLRLSWQKELLPLAVDVVAALKWRGPLMIEFIRDRKDDRWKVIEVNVRPWLLIDFFRQSGFDFLGMLLQDAWGNLPDTPSLVCPPDWRYEDAPVQVDYIREVVGRRTASPKTFCPSRLWEEHQTIQGQVSLTYDDPFDTGPGIAMRQFVRRNYGVELPLHLQGTAVHANLEAAAG